MKTIDELFEEIQVHYPTMWHNDLSNTIIQNWYAVSNNDGIIAYFGNENDAFAFRLNYINRILNGIK